MAAPPDRQSLLGGYLALLADMNAVLQRHPIATDLRLMAVPHGLDVPADHMLVLLPGQDGRGWEVQPRPIDALRPGDVPLATQLIDPRDDVLRTYATGPRAENWMRNPQTGQHNFPTLEGGQPSDR
ncbi:hypothetical protein AB0I46_41140 [Streptomyces spectabilis]|uniref:hypothetical protein n=1 Tax=Streptomyces spectabilis TaxID=68270 RepID=UPI0033D15B00